MFCLVTRSPVRVGLREQELPLDNRHPIVQLVLDDAGHVVRNVSTPHVHLRGEIRSQIHTRTTISSGEEKGGLQVIQAEVTQKTN